jgi:hypothetical protein
MNRHAYGEAWRLAVALRRPDPRPSEVGDVMTDPGAMPPPQFTVSSAETAASAELLLKKAYVWTGIAAVGGLAIGFFVGSIGEFKRSERFYRQRKSRR